MQYVSKQYAMQTCNMSAYSMSTCSMSMQTCNMSACSMSTCSMSMQTCNMPACNNYVNTNMRYAGMQYVHKQYAMQTCNMSECSMSMQTCNMPALQCVMQWLNMQLCRHARCQCTALTPCIHIGRGISIYLGGGASQTPFIHDNCFDWIKKNCIQTSSNLTWLASYSNNINE